MVLESCLGDNTSLYLPHDYFLSFSEPTCKHKGGCLWVDMTVSEPCLGGKYEFEPYHMIISPNVVSPRANL